MEHGHSKTKSKIIKKKGLTLYKSNFLNNCTEDIFGLIWQFRTI